ncbi:hypothetical protein M378DRAFT_1058818 [Amanita muscaria Koide BX008]|uniref:Uncharacterized protein n=1 Tax=Amanita muscaria (strain Koide BX008) TaxID=946122 RepID=A0A0C2X457_AMAMK|nr:hypothetical protein M378DRAFT_1058818 [Amanita muscaria Koide BX008]
MKRKRKRRGMKRMKASEHLSYWTVTHQSLGHSESDNFQPPDSGEETGTDDVDQEESEKENEVKKDDQVDIGETQDADEKDGEKEDLGGYKGDNDKVDEGDIGDIGNTEGDVVMASPPAIPPLEGSSRVTGGFARGRAIGNVLNLSDAPFLLADKPTPAKGVVRLYPDLSHQPGVNKPMFIQTTVATHYKH